MEPRLITRLEAGDFARKAYDLGVRYIGGCCGFEPYHIRAIAEEVNAFQKHYYSFNIKYLKVFYTIT